jgi:ATP-binding cassette subfamily G (WHITE) protein 2 (PDR)
MTAALAVGGPWGAIHQSEGVGQAVETAAGKLADYLPQNVEDRLPFKDTSDPSTDTDTSSDLDKIGSTQEVVKLARQLTQQDGGDQKLQQLHTAGSIKDGGGDYRNSFIDASDPALDPSSGQFRPEAWVRTLIGLQSRDPERYPQRVAGVAYKNLNVHGFGSLTDYQKYVKFGIH